MKTIVAIRDLDEFANKIVAFNLVDQIAPKVSDFKINDSYFGVISYERIPVILNRESYFTHVLDIYSSVQNQGTFANIELSFHPVNLCMREANTDEIKVLIIASTQNRIILAVNDLPVDLTPTVPYQNVDIGITGIEHSEPDI